MTDTPAEDYCESWPPDGSKIAFESDRDGNIEIYVMNADGSNQINLSNNEALDSKPRFSPDGKKIIFMSERDGNPEIYYMNIDGSNVTRLTYNAAADIVPNWQPVLHKSIMPSSIFICLLIAGVLIIIFLASVRLVSDFDRHGDRQTVTDGHYSRTRVRESTRI